MKKCLRNFIVKNFIFEQYIIFCIYYLLYFIFWIFYDLKFYFVNINVHAFRAYLNMQTMRYKKSLKRIGN